LKIWIDADAAPFEVKDIVYRAARRLNVETILVANQSLGLPPNAPMVRAILVREGANMADRYIAEHAASGDLAITADIPLASDLVAKNVSVIDPRGELLTPDNIASRLSVRNFLDDLRGAGQVLQGNRPYDDRHKRAFAAIFDRTLSAALRRAQATRVAAPKTDDPAPDDPKG
jgi:uncharacterized protein YaiI (UPF0178 family)